MAEFVIPDMTNNEAGAVVEDALRHARQLANETTPPTGEGTPLAGESLLCCTRDRLFLRGFGPEMIDLLFYEMTNKILDEDDALKHPEDIFRD